MAEGGGTGIDEARGYLGSSESWGIVHREVGIGLVLFSTRFSKMLKDLLTFLQH